MLQREPSTNSFIHAYMASFYILESHSTTGTYSVCDWNKAGLSHVQNKLSNKLMFRSWFLSNHIFDHQSKKRFKLNLPLSNEQQKQKPYHCMRSWTHQRPKKPFLPFIIQQYRKTYKKNQIHSLKRHKSTWYPPQKQGEFVSCMYPHKQKPTSCFLA